MAEINRGSLSFLQAMPFKEIFHRILHPPFYINLKICSLCSFLPDVTKKLFHLGSLAVESKVCTQDTNISALMQFGYSNDPQQHILAFVILLGRRNHPEEYYHAPRDNISNLPK